MSLNKIESAGKKAWYDGEGFVKNPYHVCYQEDMYDAWSRGGWSVHNEMEAKDRAVLQEELEKEALAQAKLLAIKEKKKTKKGRAELAGQSTLF